MAKSLALEVGRLNAERARVLMRMIENPAYSLDDNNKMILIYEITKLLTGCEFPELLPDETRA